MSLFPSFHRRRVPLYIWLPIVLACAAVGFVASTLRPIRGMPGAHVPRSEAPTPTAIVQQSRSILVSPAALSRI